MGRLLHLSNLAWDNWTELTGKERPADSVEARQSAIENRVHIVSGVAHHGQHDMAVNVHRDCD
jgi:hypothetical protein